MISNTTSWRIPQNNAYNEILGSACQTFDIDLLMSLCELLYYMQWLYPELFNTCIRQAAAASDQEDAFEINWLKTLVKLKMIPMHTTFNIKSSHFFLRQKFRWKRNLHLIISRSFSGLKISKKLEMMKNLIYIYKLPILFPVYCHHFLRNFWCVFPCFFLSHSTQKTLNLIKIQGKSDFSISYIILYLHVI